MLKTGFSDLDWETGGLQRGELVVLSSDTGAGKTSLALNISLNLAMKNRGVVFYCLASTSRDILGRLVTAEARVQNQNLLQGRLHSEDWRRLSLALENLSELNLAFWDGSEPSLEEMAIDLNRRKTEYGLDLVVVDYLQLVSPLGANNDILNIKGLKVIAESLNCSVLAISQPVLPNEGRQLTPADLGEVANHADSIWWLRTQDASIPSIWISNLDIIWAGTTKTIEVAFFTEYTRFVNYSRDIDYT